MAEAKLKFNDRELDLFKGVTTIGRASDNFVAFSGDENVSRYHAEIESRADDFYLIDLGSSNGTTLNGAKVSGEKLLKNGDKIVFGGTSKIEFSFDKESENTVTEVEEPDEEIVSEEAEEEFIEEQETEIAEDAEKTSKMPLMLGVAAIACGLAVVCAVGAVAYYYTRPVPKCEASAVILRPETGDVIKSETPIEVRADNAGCVSRAIFVLDDELVIDSTDGGAISSMIDPREYPELADGLNHSLKLVLEDEEGNAIGSPSEVLLAFETLATPTPKPEISVEPNATPKPVEQKKEVSLLETQEMAQRLVKQFAGGTAYRFDKRFLQEVQKRTTEYKTESYSQRALQYRDTISEAFIKEQNIDPPLGFILAMSRSKFVPANQNGEEGLWRISKELVTANSYDGTCEDKNLSDAAQRCAAIATSVYMKALANNIFENDFVYAVAAFGLSPLEASQMKDALPQNRQDFWLNLKSNEQREQVARFFAAGIVAENPQKFGLKTDAPLSEMYKIFMTQ
ncbi:MAG: FHA domain-containing protein [Pyrinomonadaceae bacterium]